MDKVWIHDWKQRKLGEVFEQTTNFVNPDKGEIELWSLTVEDGLTPKSERYNREFLVKKNANFKKVRPGDIVYNPMNMTLGAVGYNGMLKNVAVSGYYITMFVKTGYDSYYINTWLKSPQALSLYKTFATGSLIEKQRVQFSTLSIIPTVFPEYEEQKRIGCYFNNLDSLITFHHRKLNILNKICRYAWEQRKLGEIVNRITRKNSKLISELPLTISAQQGLIDQNEFFDKRVASKDVSGYYLIKNGEFAYNRSTSNDAPWGAIKRLDRYENGVLSTLYIVFEIKDETLVNSDFLVAYYNTNLWHKGIHEIAAEGARNHGLLNIAPTDFFKTKLKLPADIEEQQEIGEYFKKIDSLITFHQQKCDELKNIKKFMLQNMFVSEK